MEDRDPFDEYAVVVNGEGQHSIWPTRKSMPAGWTPTGTCGSRAECLDHIERTWLDMRPTSVVESLSSEN